MSILYRLVPTNLIALVHILRPELVSPFPLLTVLVFISLLQTALAQIDYNCGDPKLVVTAG